MSTPKSVIDNAKKQGAKMVDVKFVDTETLEVRDVEVTPALAAAYRKEWERHTEALEQFCGRYNIGYVRADVERPVEEIILQTFRQGRFVA